MTFNPALVGIGVLSASAIVGGGVAVNGILNEDSSLEEDIKASQNPELKIKSTEWDNWHSLVDDKDFSKNVKNKYGDKHNRHFVGVAIKPSNSNDNSPWWRWTYKEHYKSNANGGFSRSLITNWQQLRDACGKAYKGTVDPNDSKLVKGATGDQYNYLISEIWSFCTPVNQVPVSVVAGEYASGTIGESEKTKLASIKGNNDYFWLVKGYYFLSWDDPKKKGYEFFNKLIQEKKAKHDYMSMRDWCEKAYKKEPASSSSVETPTSEEVVRYCSIEEPSS